MLMQQERIKVERVSFGSVMKSIQLGIYRIPRFQRKFVWEHKRIQYLLDSMYREYPIGTIFLWEAPADFNHMIRTVDYLRQPPLENHQTYTLILDGQQRLTSLYVTVNGLTVDDKDYSKIVADLANQDSERFFQYGAPDNQRWVSIRDLLREDMFTVYDQLSDVYRRRFTEMRQRLSNYPFSIVKVVDMDLEDAIEIFERINKGTKPLTRFDLIAASILTDQFDLRERLRRDIVEPLKDSFGEIPETNVPQALALNIKGRTEHTTQMGLNSHEVQTQWNRTVECLRLAVDFLQHNLSVRRLDFLPYSAMLPVLSYYFFRGETNAIKSTFHRDQLERWFWRTTFSERYSTSSQTRMTEDADQIRKLLEDNTPFDFARMPFTLDENSLIEVNMDTGDSAVRKGILCMLAFRRPLHFLNSSEISLTDSHFASFKKSEHHRIFPSKLFKKRKFRRSVQRLPNFCFVPADVEQSIADESPSVFFANLHEIHRDSGDFDKIMSSHLIPVDDDSGIWTDDYEAFLQQRSRLLLMEIKRLCGISTRIVEEQRNPVIDAIEVALRDQIHHSLSTTQGLDYWRKAVPSDVHNRVKERIEAVLSNVPGSERSQYNDPRMRLDHVDVSDYVKIITNSQNWSAFSSSFRSKSECERYLRDFQMFRNAWSTPSLME